MTEDGQRYFTVDDFREVKKLGKRDDGLPPLELLSDVELNKPTEEEINTNARIIKNTLLEFDVEVEVIDVKVGPTVTQYAVSPYTESVNDEGETILNRVRVSQIANLNGDLALALSAKRLRIQAPVPGHSYVGVEVPNRQPSLVALRPVLEAEKFYQHRKHPLALPLGRDVSGEPFIADLASMPHLLIAGTTGSGKSIMLAAMTTAFIMNNPPDRVKLIMLDPKMVELSRFNGIPHLLGPVETELDRIVEVLRWTTREMELRYKLLEKEAARNIETYNKALGKRRQSEQLPYLVVIIDEIGDLMMQRPDETERALTRLAQMARAVGIHLTVATQRPSVDVITGLIKANFPARISFAVASSVDSRVILDSVGAETLMGRGDMLFLAPDASGPQRIQGCHVGDDEVNGVVAYWKEWYAKEIEEGRMEPLNVAPWERGLTRREVLAETDPMLEDAIALVIEAGEASASLIQRRLGLGYPRAARIMDMMQELGVVGGPRPGGRSREVLIRPGADPFKKLIEKRLQNKSQ
jgi:S-DNA-T family DNA segregation ATPase FtsK/SpoIIIE